MCGVGERGCRRQSQAPSPLGLHANPATEECGGGEGGDGVQGAALVPSPHSVLRDLQFLQLPSLPDEADTTAMPFIQM